MRQPLNLTHVDLLGGVPLFKDLDRVALAKITAHLESVSVPQGTIVFREGDPGDAFYLVIKGTFGVYATAPDGRADIRLNVLGFAEPFGEMALLTNRPRSATIRAEREGEVLRLDRVRFLELVNQEPGVLLAIAATLSDRMPRGDGPSHERHGVPATAETETLDTTSPDDQAHQTSPASQWWQPNRAAIGGLLAGAALLAGWVLPPPLGLTLTGWYALMTLVAVVPVLALDVLPEGIVALALAGVWVVGGVVPTPVALNGFASSSWVLVVSVLTVGAAIASSGLLYRLALWTVAHTRGGFGGQVLTLGVAGVLMGPAVPNATSRVTLIAPALTELVEALGYAPRSREAAGLAMATLIGFGQMAAAFLTSSTTAVLVFAVLPSSARADLNWVTWALRAAPVNVGLFLGLMAAIIWLYRPRGGGSKSSPGQPGALVVQRALLGAPSRNERIALVVGALLLLGFMTQPLHHIHPTWIAVLALTILASTGVVTVATLRTMNWSFALLFGILASMSKVFESTQVDRWVAHVVTDAVGALASAPMLFVAVLTLVCFAVSLVLRWQAAAPLLTIALAPVAETADLNPLMVGLVALIAGNGFFLPYQSTTYLALYHGTGGQLFSHAQARSAAFAYGLVTLLSLCISVPIWQKLGLL